MDGTLRTCCEVHDVGKLFRSGMRVGRERSRVRKEKTRHATLKK